MTFSPIESTINRLVILIHNQPDVILGIRMPTFGITRSRSLPLWHLVLQLTRAFSDHAGSYPHELK